MFVPYSSDVYPEYRPWLAYLTFPVFVILSFYLVANGHVPSMDSLDFGPMFRIAGTFLFFYMLGTFLVLWMLGKAVCSKIGNFRYTIGLFVLFILFAGISWVDINSDIIWFLSWFTSGIAGVYLVFYPVNSIDCFIVVPPFPSFLITGYWLILLWLLADFLFALILRWYWACLLHPVAFVLGIVYAGLLLKLGWVSPHPDERTLWEVLTRKEPEDRFWKASWSVRKKQEQQQKTAQEQSDDRIRQEISKKDLSKGKIRSAISAKDSDLAILCECGQVVYASVRTKEGKIQCPACGHFIHSPTNQ